MQVYLAHKKDPPPTGPPYDPRYTPTAGSYGGAVSYERGTSVRATWHQVGHADTTRVMLSISHTSGETFIWANFE